MKCTLLTENTANKKGLLAEHGFSVLVEACGKRLLFDTGQSDVYLKNAEKLGVSLSQLDGIVLSHGHYDHCGGLAYFPKELKMPDVYVGKGAFLKKCFQDKNKESRFIGIPWEREQLLFERGISFQETDGIKEIFPGIFLIDQILPTEDFDGVAEGFYIDGEKRTEDKMLDEQILVIKEDYGLHVIAGCAHVGICSCLAKVQECFPGEKIGTVLAGMHLRSASEGHIQKVISRLKELNPEILVPVHCTGMQATVSMKLSFGKKCRLGEVGVTLEV